MKRVILPPKRFGGDPSVVEAKESPCKRGGLRACVIGGEEKFGVEETTERWWFGQLEGQSAPVVNAGSGAADREGWGGSRAFMQGKETRKSSATEDDDDDDDDNKEEGKEE